MLTAKKKSAKWLLLDKYGDTPLLNKRGKVLSNFTTITWITAKAVIHIPKRVMMMNFDIKKVCQRQTTGENIRNRLVFRSDRVIRLEF